jgi:hypothetical protein
VKSPRLARAPERSASLREREQRSTVDRPVQRVDNDIAVDATSNPTPVHERPFKVSVWIGRDEH